jgi:hypothetical protein
MNWAGILFLAFLILFPVGALFFFERDEEPVDAAEVDWEQFRARHVRFLEPETKPYDQDEDQ